MHVKTGSGQSNLFDILKHADTASQRKRSLDRLEVIDWESFRPVLDKHLAYGDQSKGGRIPWCPVLAESFCIIGVICAGATTVMTVTTQATFACNSSSTSIVL